MPELLSGLKTAFWGSVFGVGGALLIKLRDFFLGHSESETDVQKEDVSAGDLLQGLKDIQKSLAGSEEGSLISQIKLSRQDMNDRLDLLKAAQTEALAKLSEMSSKTLVEALRDVIRDFNQKITEQFGENFKELNEAVGRLLLWQEQYKKSVETITARLDESTAHMARSTESFGTMVNHSTAFTTAASNLSTLITTLENQKQHLQTVATSLAQLLEKASGSLPQVEQKIVELARQLGAAMEQNQKALSSALTENAAAIQKTIKAANEGMTSANADTAKQLVDMSNRVKEQVTVLDKALETELEKSLNSLGRQLTALSDRFVADYTPLTEKLRRLVEIGR